MVERFVRGLGFTAVLSLFCSTAAAQPPAARAGAPFGVLVGGRVPAGPVTRLLDDLHATWIRLNDHLAGAGPDVVRLSVGLEDKDDIIADLEQALTEA